MLSVLTSATSLWLLVGLAGVGLVTMLAARNARPVSSIAKVLYDVENPEHGR